MTTLDWTEADIEEKMSRLNDYIGDAKADITDSEIAVGRALQEVAELEDSIAEDEAHLQSLQASYVELEHALEARKTGTDAYREYVEQLGQLKMEELNA